MKNFLKQIGASLIALTLFSLLAVGLVSNSLLFKFRKNIFIPTEQHQALQANSLLHITLEGELTEHKKNAFSAKLSIAEIAYGLKKAAQEDCIKGIFIELTPYFNPKGYAYLDSLLHHIKTFQKSGKPVAVYGESYNLPLLAAFSSADIMTLNPMGEINPQGPAFTLFNYREALDRIGVTPVVYKSGKNKNFGEMYTNSEPSEDTKEGLLSLMNAFYRDSLKKIQANKGISPEEIQNINTNHLFLDPQQATQYSIIDMIGHKDEAIEKLQNLIHYQGAKPTALLENEATSKEQIKTHAIDLTAYVREKQSQDRSNFKKSAQIVILPLEGEVLHRNSKKENTISPKETIEIIKKYTEDDQCKALVVVMDSPGGSAMTSEKIFHELSQTAKTKTVVALIRNVGASGGYYIVMNADWIIAHEQSIVGSIGTINVGFEISKLLQKLGIHAETIKASPNSVSTYHPLSEKQKELMQDRLNYVNQLFRSRLIQSRNLNPEKLDEFADGRVFLAHQAKEHGLIDQIGDLNDAIAKAAKLADLNTGEFSVVYHTEQPPIKDILLRFIMRERQSHIPSMMHK